MKTKNNALKFFLEIVTIFIGITLSFAFEEFRQARNDKSQEKEIIRSLIADIVLKKNEIRQDIDAIKWEYMNIDSCILFSKKGQIVPPSLMRNFYSTLSADYSHFDPTTPSYLSLTSTGLWQQLPDRLRREIHDCYTGNFNALDKMYQKGNEYSSFIQERYLVPSSLLGSTSSEPYFDLMNGALAKSEFRSALMLFRNQKFNTIHRLERTLNHLDHLNESLEASLND